MGFLRFIKLRKNCGELMSTAQAILILAILLLGGVVAVVGDRLGTKIGKARLSLFNLRPRKTATLVTILTGATISALTFGLLFALSGELRKGVFEYEKNQKRLRQTRAALEQTSQDLVTTESQKAQTEAALSAAKNEQAKVKQQLSELTSQLGDAQTQLAQKEQRLIETDRSLATALSEQASARAEADRVVGELSRTRRQLDTVSRQTAVLRSEITGLEREKNQLIAQKDGEIRSKELAIQEQESRLQQLQARLGDLEKEQKSLEGQVQKLQEDAEALAQKNIDLRSRSFAIQRGQVLASAVVRVIQPRAANQAIDRLLQEANRQTSRLLRFSNGDQVDRNQRILPARSEVNRLIQQIGDGREYVLRVVSIANYLENEEVPVIVRIDAVENRQVFKAGDVITSIMIDPTRQNSEGIRQSFDQLLLAVGLRAQLLGVVNDSIDIGSIQDLSRFLEQVRQAQTPLQVKAIAAKPIFAAGPLKIEFLAERDGQTLFRSE